MDKETKAALLDMHAFIQWAERNNKKEMIIPTLSHDIAELLNNEPCFTPRTHGYYQDEVYRTRRAAK